MRRFLIGFIPFMFASSGCGTIANMRGETVVSMGGPFPVDTAPFGGVVQDTKTMVAFPAPVVKVLMIADVPFSLAGDIVTLPWATAKYIAERKRDESPSKNQSADKTTH